MTNIYISKCTYLFLQIRRRDGEAVAAGQAAVPELSVVPGQHRSRGYIQCLIIIYISKIFIQIQNIPINISILFHMFIQGQMFCQQF